MSADVPDDLFVISDLEIDPQQIMDQIRERIRKRRGELGYDSRLFPTFGATAYPGEPRDIPSDPDLHHHLRLANETYPEVETGPALLPSPATRVPVLGRLWGLVRQQMHSLVLFYVNRLVAHQTGVNRHLVSVLNRLTWLSEEQQRRITGLEREIAVLRRQGGSGGTCT